MGSHSEAASKKGYEADVREDFKTVARASVEDICAYGRWNPAIFAVFVLVFSIPVKIKISEVCFPPSEVLGG